MQSNNHIMNENSLINSNLDSFRLFTFMNCKDETFDDRKLPLTIETNCYSERNQYKETEH